MVQFERFNNSISPFFSPHSVKTLWAVLLGTERMIAESRKKARNEGFGSSFEAQGERRLVPQPSSLAMGWESGKQLCVCFALNILFTFLKKEFFEMYF